MYTVFLGSEPIGLSPLDYADLAMGVVHGSFTPAPAYERVRPVFQLFSEAEGGNREQLMRYYSTRDALDLRLFDPEGRQVNTTAIHIYDYSAEAGPEGYELEVHLADASKWRQSDPDQQERI